MKKFVMVLSLMMMLFGANAYGKETDENKEVCDISHFLIRMCGYYGAFGSAPCSTVLPIVKGIFTKYGFTEEQATSLGTGCVVICSSIKDNVLSLIEFEKNTNNAYLKCLQNSFTKEGKK